MPDSKRNPARERAIEKIIRSSVVYGWDLAQLGHPRPVVEIEWDDDGSPRITVK